MRNGSGRRRRIDVLRPEEVADLLKATETGKLEASRNRALVALLYGAGLRISEALELRPVDVDLDVGTVAVQRAKGKRRRVAALVPDAADVVRQWADRRATLAVTASAPFFCTVRKGRVRDRDTRPGLPLRREYVRVMLNRLADRAGIGKRVHAHGFRHSHAHLLRERGWDVEEIRKQLGHSNLLVTSDYLDHIGAHRLPERMREIGAVLEAAAR